MATTTLTQQVSTIEQLYDLAAEDAVIGILLFEPARIAELVDILSADCFSEQHRQIAFDAILADCRAGVVPEVADIYRMTNDLFYAEQCIELFFDVANGDIKVSDLAQYADRVRRAKDLRNLGYGATAISKPARGDVGRPTVQDDDLPEWAKPSDYDPQFISDYANKKIATGGDLARSAWGGGAVMAAPKREHFDGDYPKPPDHKTCSTYWSADIYKGGDKGHKIKARGVPHRVLHPYMGKGGQVIGACPHCLHERTIELCKQIERASEQYTIDNLIRHDMVTSSQAKRIGDRIRQRNKRAKDNNTGVIYSVVKVPQDNGQVWILHDLPDLAGDPLPSDRGDLYPLIEHKIKHTPKGKRGWRGLSSWGSQANESGKQSDNAKAKDKRGDDFVASLLGENWSKFSILLQGYLDLDKPVTKRGVSFDVDLGGFLQWLDDAGFNYAVIDGQLPNVTDKARQDKKTCVKCDKPQKKPAPGSSWRGPDDLINDIPGF